MKRLCEKFINGVLFYVLLLSNKKKVNLNENNIRIEIAIRLIFYKEDFAKYISQMNR